MIKKSITKLLFMDIETVGCCPDYTTCSNTNPILANQFEKYFDWFVKRFPEVDVTNEPEDTMFRKRTALVPEFSKIICISFAFVLENGEIKKQSFYGDDEYSLLDKTQKLLQKCEKLDFHLCGHNIKNFDIPMLAKRMIVHGLMPPSIIPSYDTKPWEMKVVDTKEVWQYGSFGTISSLDLLCNSLGIESSKNGDITGDCVHDGYWLENKLEEIKDYCEKDVDVLIEIIKKFKELK